MRPTFGRAKQEGQPIAEQIQTHPDAQRLCNARKILRKVSRNIERQAALPGYVIKTIQTRAEDCVIQGNTILERLKTVRWME